MMTPKIIIQPQRRQQQQQRRRSLMMRMSVYYNLFFCCFFITSHGVDGRHWIDVVDPDIFLANVIDIGRYKNGENDPFDYSSSSSANANLESNVSNTIDEKTNNSNNNNQNTPTSPPTARYNYIVGNGGCPVGKHLYEVRMIDSWGDGWGDGSLRLYAVNNNINTTGATVDGEEKIVSDPDTKTVSVSQNVEIVQNNKPNRTEIFRDTLTHGQEGISNVVST